MRVRDDLCGRRPWTRESALPTVDRSGADGRPACEGKLEVGGRSRRCRDQREGPLRRPGDLDDGDLARGRCCHRARGAAPADARTGVVLTVGRRRSRRVRRIAVHARHSRHVVAGMRRVTRMGRVVSRRRWRGLRSGCDAVHGVHRTVVQRNRLGREYHDQPGQRERCSASEQRPTNHRTKANWQGRERSAEPDQRDRGGWLLSSRPGVAGGQCVSSFTDTS